MILGSIKVKLVLLLIILLHAFVLTKLIFFPYPELFVYPYLTNQGLKPYAQIFDQHFPGLMFLPINLNNLGMTSPEAARVWLIGIVILTQLLLFFVSKKILGSEKKALLVNILYIFWQPFFEGWVLWIDSFLPLMLLPAFYFIYRGKFFWAGLFLGLGIVFKQVLIPLTGLVFLYLLYQTKSVKKVGNFLVGLLVPVAAIQVYLVSIGVFQDFWYWTITFNLTTFAEFGRKAPFFSGLVRVVWVLIFVGLLWWQRKSSTAQLLAIFIIGSLTTIFARFDFIHFQPALPFVVLATVIGFEKIWQQPKAKVLMMIYLLVMFWWMVVFYRGHISEKVFFFDQVTLQTAVEIRQRTQPQEEIFLFGPVLHLYFLSETIPAGRIFVFQFPWFMMETEERLVKTIDETRPKLVVRDRTVEIEGQKITDFASKLDAFIEENYVTFKQVGANELMIPK